MSSTNEQEIVLSPWRPEAYLEKVDLTSSFFGRILVEEFFKPEHKVLREEFLYIFEVFKLSFQDIEISSNATNKPAGGKTFYFHCEGINAIQLSDSSIQNIEELLTGLSSNNSLILIEYLIRKLVCLSSLSELFRGAKFLSQRLIPHQHFRSSTLIRIKVSDRVIDLTLLFSDDFIKKKVSSVNLFDSNKGLERGVYLCFLMIPVAEIEEYLKSGTVIDLDIPMATRAYLRLNEREAVVGTLLNADGKWAFKPSSKESFVISGDMAGKTILFIELFKVKLQDTKFPFADEDLLLSNYPLSNSVQVLFGNKLAKAGKIYHYDQKLALMID